MAALPDLRGVRRQAMALLPVRRALISGAGARCDAGAHRSEESPSIQNLRMERLPLRGLPDARRKVGLQLGIFQHRRAALPLLRRPCWRIVRAEMERIVI